MTTRKFLYLDEDLVAPPDPTGLPDRSVVITKDGVTHVLVAGSWTTPGGGGSGGGIGLNRFLLIDETTMADTKVLTEDTTGAVSGDPASPDVSLTGWTCWPGTGVTLVDPHPSPWVGAGTGARAFPARDRIWQLTAPKVGRTNVISINTPSYNVAEPAVGTATAYRVDVVYRNMWYASQSWIEIRGAWNENDDGRRSINQAADLDSQLGPDLVGWSPTTGLQEEITFFRQRGFGPYSDANGWQVATVTVPGDVQYVDVDYVMKTDQLTLNHVGLEIAEVRVTPILDGAADGTMVLEEATGCIWLYDRSPGVGGVTGQGWYLIRPGEYMTGPSTETLIQNVGARAINDRVPVVLTGTIPDTTAAGATVALSIAGAPQDTSVLPWVVPDGLQIPNQGQVRCGTVAASAGVSGDVVLRAVKHDIETPANVDPWPGMPSFAILNTTTWNGGGPPGDTASAFGLFHNYNDAYAATSGAIPNSALYALGDSLAFYLDVAMGATSGPVDVVVTIYFGGRNG